MNASDVGRIALSMGRYNEAISQMQESIRLYASVGDLALHAVEHMNLSFTLNAAGRHEQAFEVATTRLQFAEDRGDSYLVSALACNAAEACALLDQFEAAERWPNWPCDRKNLFTCTTS